MKRYEQTKSYTRRIRCKAKRLQLPGIWLVSHSQNMRPLCMRKVSSYIWSHQKQVHSLPGNRTPGARNDSTLRDIPGDQIAS